MSRCTNKSCGVPTLGYWHWCESCWVQFWKGIAGTLGVALAAYLVRVWFG